MNFLDHIPMLDWASIRDINAINSEILSRLVSDKALLSQMIQDIRSDEHLYSLCERHAPFDKLVLYDAPDRGFRLRLHIWRAAESERVHQHRFSLTTRILRGSYSHVLYDCRERIGDGGGHAVESMDPQHSDDRSQITPEDVLPIMVTTVNEGDSYTLHYSALHATFPQPGCISLCLRGPAEKVNSFVFDRGNNSVYWRFGREQETQQRVSDKRMTAADFEETIDLLKAKSVID